MCALADAVLLIAVEKSYKTLVAVLTQIDRSLSCMP
jgi:hypothetical protein